MYGYRHVQYYSNKHESPCIYMKKDLAFCVKSNRYQDWFSVIWRTLTAVALYTHIRHLWVNSRQKMNIKFFFSTSFFPEFFVYRIEEISNVILKLDIKKFSISTRLKNIQSPTTKWQYWKNFSKAFNLNTANMTYM